MCLVWPSSNWADSPERQLLIHGLRIADGRSWRRRRSGAVTFGYLIDGSFAMHFGIVAATAGQDTAAI